MEIEQEKTIWEKMARVSPDLFCVFDRDGKFLEVNNACSCILGYASKELVGQHYNSFLHPDYVNLSYLAGQNIRQCANTNNFENCFIHKNGKTVFMHWSSIWSEEDQLFFSVGRDFTDQKMKELRYKTLLDNNPDIIFTENPDGFFTDVNAAFCAVFGISKEDALQQHKSSLLPPEVIAICEMTFQDAIQGVSVSFSLEINTAYNEVLILEVIKIPIIFNSDIVGVQTIAKNITPTVESFRTIKQQTRKLNTIFESITDGFCMLDRNWNIIYINSEAEKLLHLNREVHVGKDIREIFPEEVGGEFYNHYLNSFETGQSVHFTSYLKEINSWFRVKAFPSAEGLSIYFDDVSEQVKLSKKLEMLSLVASHTTNGVIIANKAREIEWVNEGFTRLTGYNMEEVVGKIPSEFLNHPNNNVSAFEAVKSKMLQGEPVAFEILTTRKDKKEIWVSVQVNPILDKQGKLEKYVTVQTDITERVNSQKELEKLSLVASKTDNGVVITDANGLTEWVNESFTKITGYSFSEIVGRKPGDVLQGQETELATIRMVRENLRQGVHFNTNLINYKKSGEKFWVSMDITPIYDNSGKLIQFIAIQKDITFHKDSEAKLVKMTQDLYNHNKDLQQFSYIVSHNLRAPVANAIGYANLLTRIDRNSEQFDISLSYLKNSVFRLDTVLKDVNSILNVRDNKESLQLEELDINTVIGQALSTLQEQLQNCRGSIINNLSNGLRVWANKAYLYSIFYNLFSNAIKYRNKERNLVIRIKCYGHSEQGSLISFSDNGSGFDINKAKDNIFKLYKRFHQDKNGRGIGLYLVKSHLDAMNGYIEVNSKVGVGTRFLIYLPKK